MSIVRIASSIRRSAIMIIMIRRSSSIVNAIGSGATYARVRIVVDATHPVRADAEDGARVGKVRLKEEYYKRKQVVALFQY